MSTEINAAPETPASPAAPAAPVEKSAFYVVQQAVSEDGATYLKNQMVMLTADRAKALGDMVRPWSDTYVLPQDATIAGIVHKKGDTVTIPRDVAVRLGGLRGIAPAPVATPAPVNAIPQPAAPATASKPAVSAAGAQTTGGSK